MKYADFEIGKEFTISRGRWRCTDIGTRVIVAIRVDRVVTCRPPHKEPTILDYVTAEAEGWFNGPPYAVAEIVIDETSMESCVKCASTINF